MATAESQAQQQRRRAVLGLLGRTDGGEGQLCIDCLTQMLPHSQVDVEDAVDGLAEDELVSHVSGSVELTDTGRDVLLGSAVR